MYLSLRALSSEIRPFSDALRMNVFTSEIGTPSLIISFTLPATAAESFTALVSV